MEAVEDNIQLRKEIFLFENFQQFSTGRFVHRACTSSHNRLPKIDFPSSKSKMPLNCRKTIRDYR